LIDYIALGQAITTGGAIVALTWVIREVLSDRGSLVPRWVHAALQKDRDEWRGLALKGTTLAERATKVAAATAAKAE
jgi:hypothetical protein